MPPQSSGGHASFPSIQIGEERQFLLEDHGVLPVVAEIVGVGHLGSGPPEHAVELDGAFVFDRRHSHVEVIWIGSPEEAVSVAELVHMAVVPAHRSLQRVVQF